MNVDPQETSSAPVRMSLPPAVVHDILTLGIPSSDNETLRQTTCIVRCYCWFNRADTGVLLCRFHVSFDNRLLRCWHNASASWQRPGSLYWSLPTEKSLCAPVVGHWIKILLCWTTNRSALTTLSILTLFPPTSPCGCFLVGWHHHLPLRAHLRSSILKMPQSFVKLRLSPTVDLCDSLETLLEIDDWLTEVSLISRELNLRFERISISRRFLWKSFSSFPSCTRHDCRRGLVAGHPKLASFGPRSLFDYVRHFIVKHIPFESVLTSNDSIFDRAPSEKALFNQNRFFGTNRFWPPALWWQGGARTRPDRRGHTWTASGRGSPRGGRRGGSGRPP